MRAWWENLAERERRIVALAAIVVLVAGGFLFVVEPALERRDALHRQLQILVDEQAWMEAQAPAVRARVQMPGSAAPAAARPGGSPLGVVDSTARAAGLTSALRRVRPLENGVEAEFEGASYAALMRWLGTLEMRHALRVVSLSVDPGPEPGRVNAQVRIEPVRS